MKKIVHLIVRPDGSTRASHAKGRPRIAADEVAIKITLDFPPSWGTVIHEMTVKMPEAPTVVDKEVVQRAS